MQQPHFIIDQSHTYSENPVLIIDREGTVGCALYEKIKSELLVVLAGGVAPKSSHNIIFLPYKKVIPEIPDGDYSLFIAVSDSKTDLLDIATQMIKKAEEQNTKFILVIHKEKYDKTIVDKVISLYEKAYVIVLGELVLATLEKKHFSSIDSILLTSSFHGLVRLSDMGLRKTHAVFFDDAIQAILQTIFGIQQQPRRSLIYPKDPITELSVVHEIQKADPLVRIDFSGDSNHSLNHEQHIPGVQTLPEPYPLKEKIRKVFKELSSVRERHHENIPYLAKVQPESFLPTKRFPKIPILLFLYAIIVYIIFPLLAVAVAGGGGWYFLSQSKHHILSGNFSRAKQDALYAKRSFTLAEYAMGLVNIEAAVLHQQEHIASLDEKIATGEYSAALTGKTLAAAEKITAVVSGNAHADIFVDALHDIQNSLVAVENIEQENTLPDKEKKEVMQFDGSMRMAANTINILPFALGIYGKKTYLVLFQNNMELRPGGGFIGSYGLLQMDRGHIADFSIHDVYDADGQLKKYIEPPFALRRYLPQGQGYLRDSNFDVDFAQSAQAATFLLQEETGVTADGVVGIDLSFVKSLLEIIGPVRVAEYNEMVNKDTFFQQTEKHAEQDFFPGSTQKKDFLKFLFAAIQQKLQTQKTIPYATLFRQIPHVIEQKHLLFALRDSSYQKELSLNGFSSTLLDTRKDDAGVINDFMGISDANLGANKSNYFLTRSIMQQAALDKSGIIQETVAITYTNKSEAGKWPGGDYKNYLRIILPENTDILDVAIDRDRQNVVTAIRDPLVYENKAFLPPNGLEVEKTQEAGKIIYGFLVTIPAGKTKTVTITYQLGQKSNLAYPAVKYNLRVFKQPGTDNDAYSFSLNYPDVYKMFASTKGVTNGSQANFNTNLLTDQTIEVNLAKK